MSYLQSSLRSLLNIGRVESQPVLPFSLRGCGEISLLPAILKKFCKVELTLGQMFPDFVSGQASSSSSCGHLPLHNGVADQPLIHGQPSSSSCGNLPLHNGVADQPLIKAFVAQADVAAETGIVLHDGARY